MIKVLPLAGLMGLLSLSCASECTDMGCLSGLDVELRPPVDGSGVSSLKVRLDNAEIACSVAPEANCDGARLSWEGGQLRAISVDKVRPEQVEIQLLQGDEVV